MESQSPTHRPVGSQPEYSAVGPYFTLFSLRLFEGEIMLWEMLAGHENLSQHQREMCLPAQNYRGQAGTVPGGGNKDQ